MKEKIYTYESLRRRMQEGISGAANRLTELKAVIESDCKAARWGAGFVWALHQYPEVRDYLCDNIRKDAAEREGLNCDYGAPAFSEEIRFNRKFVEMRTGKVTKAITGFVLDADLAAYLRIGAIYFSKGGAIEIAANAAELIEDYCSVYIENGREKALYERIRALQASAKALQEAHSNFIASLDDAVARKTADAYKWRFSPDKIYISESLPLNSENVVWRTFITYCAQLRKASKPHFYNEEGTPNLSIAELYEATGYKPEATAELRYKFPALYANEPYSYKELSSQYTDSPEGLEELRSYLKRTGSVINERGNIIRPESYSWRNIVAYPEPLS